jgi:Mn2+/Fe2+ NRAMP family transporter
MTTGAAYDLCQTFGWKHGLGLRPREAKKFYASIVFFTVLAMAMNFFGINPIKALVWSGIVQGFSTPPLMLLILLLTSNRRIMGAHVNSTALNVLGWTTLAFMTAATLGLVVTWFI